MKIHISIFGFLITGLIGCSGEKGTGEQENSAPEEEIVYNEEQSELPDGFKLLETTCINCHSPNPENEVNVAPTLANIKSSYLASFENETDFINAMQTFLLAPNAENAIMTEAIAKYGIMPQMSLQETQAKAIAKYILQNKVEDVDWYANEYPSEQDRIGMLISSYLDKGFEYASATKSVLGKNLKGKINSDGTLAAVNFCNIKALHFTDSMSTVYNAEIKRVSDQPRNPNNEANIEELAIINDFKQQLENGATIIPTTVEYDDHVTGYYPILTNELCIKCHGNPAEMDGPTYEKITALYPKDMAVGYTTDQLRGIWVVDMLKE